MEVLINGVPKSGCHALLKGVELLGVAGAFVDHRAYGGEVPARHLYIKRNPRNVLISMARWQCKVLAQGPLIALMQDFFDKKPMAQYFAAFEPWLTSGAHVVAYEDLVRSDVCLRRVAEHLQLPYLEDAFPNLPGLTVTWTGAPSDWTQHWTPAVDWAWTDYGMAATEIAWGY